MLIICYTSNQTQKYGEFSSMDDFKAQLPLATIEYAFSEDDNINVKSFLQDAKIYGLQETDLMRRFINNNGETCIITGIEPRNRKYPIIVYSEDRQRRLKCSVLSIKKALDRIS